MNREEAREKAEELVDQMTAEEMCSQLRYNAPAIERLGIPAYNWWNEGIHGAARGGTATVFPQTIGLGATFDVKLLKEIGGCVGRETRARYNEASRRGDRDIYKGLTVWAPNINIFRDPRWGRGQETYGEDPYLTGMLGSAMIEGLQGKGKHLLTAACAKHFAVHSGPESQRHFFNAKVTMKDLWETYLPAFETCVKNAHVEAVMGAYNRTNGEPCCAHTYLMEKVLRGMWNFQGHYVSDCWAIRDFHENHKVTKDPAHSAKLALSKGCDLNCGCTYLVLSDALKEHLISREQVRCAAVRLFTTRYLLGMFEGTEYDTLGIADIDTDDHRRLASRAAAESMVLLKNDGILPLDPKKVRSICVIGPDADSRRALLGNYHGTPSRFITVLEGIEDLAGDDITVRYAQGCQLFRNREEDLAQPGDRISEALAAAEQSDVIILCLGLDETLEGEEGDDGNTDASGDKKDLELPASQTALLKAVAETGKPVILCSMTGSPIDLTYADVHVSAILQTWYPGGRGGLDVAKVIFGKERPSGKLPVTFYRDLKDFPAFTDYSMKGRTYRYLKGEPLYPFGYGLNYGKTEVTGISETSASGRPDLSNEKSYSVLVEMRNRGEYPADEVLQIYARVEGTPNEVPNVRLCTFTRVHLKAGETRKAVVSIPYRAAETVNENGQTVIEGTILHLYAGFGQPDERTKQLTGTEARELIIRIR